MKNEKIKIEIWSDFVCPFCYIGKAKLMQAISTLGAQNKVEIIWHSFQLDPDFPKDKAMPSTLYLSQKKGFPVEQLKGMYQHLSNSGKAYNIDFQFEKAITFNTHNAHRLWQWSKKFSKEGDLKEALMKAYFTDGIDLSKRENLLECIESIGLEKSEAQRILDSTDFAQEVELDIYQARQTGLRGVPYFLINDSKVIAGAQDDKVFEGVLQSAISEG
jgi:predicted DsbA family dithiol-disulfide isomerase